MKKTGIGKSSATSKSRARYHEDDAPPLTRALLKKAVLMPPVTDPNWERAMGDMQRNSKRKSSKKEVALTLEPEVYRWFRTQGEEASARINALLKDYIHMLEQHTH